MNKQLKLFNFLLLILLFQGCSTPNVQQEIVKNIPEDISSFLVYSKSCNTLFYSSNKENLYQIYKVDLSKDNFRPSKIEIPIAQDLFVRSVSTDCQYLSFVSDNNGNQKYDVFLYDMHEKRVQNLTNTKNTDEGNPQFSPLENKIAWIASGILQIYSIEKEQVVYSSSMQVQSYFWSANNLIYFEDDNSSIWSLNPINNKLLSLWSSPSKSFVPKMFAIADSYLLFISDHEGFSKIYKMNLVTKELGIPVNINHDLYSPQMDSLGNLYFRMNVDGEILNYCQDVNGQISKIGGKNSGVSYHYFKDSGVNINLFSDIDHPKSIQIEKESSVGQQLINPDSIALYSKVQKIRTKDLMSHYVFTPLNKSVKGWIVWIHGGPHEQISPRYNVFYNYLNKEGWGIVCINYIGSIGLGNEFELRDTRSKNNLKIQSEYIKNALDEIFKKIEVPQNRLTIIGVSYGGMLAHNFVEDYPEMVDKIIDFSGLSYSYPGFKLWNEHLNHSYLFIAGENDFASNLSKYKYVLYCKIKAKTEFMLIDDEGHFIRRRESLKNVLNRIIAFLEQ